jgi:ADP-heptose:LPS heptosyltransferase
MPDGRPVLVALRALGLGDFLTGLPALRGLADAFPGHRRLLAAPAALAPLATLAGCVDGVVPVGPLEPLPASVHGADVGVNLHGRGPESHRVLLAARPGRLIAFAHPDIPETAGSPPWPGDDVHEVVRWCGLLQAQGIPVDPDRLDLPAPVGEPLPADAAGATVIHPGAASPARRWPADRFAAVAAAEAAAGRTVLVTAGPGEERLAATVVRLATARATNGRGRSEPPGPVAAGVAAAGPTTLRGLAALVASAGRMVCGDTGVAHLATALGTPSVVLFGPTPPSRWGPPPGRPIHAVLWSGATGDPHADHPDPGLLRITVADVTAALAGLPARPVPEAVA